MDYRAANSCSPCRCFCLFCMARSVFQPHFSPNYAKSCLLASRSVPCAKCPSKYSAIYMRYRSASIWSGRQVGFPGISNAVAGETMACGSGACAAVVAGRLRGLLDERVRVYLPGGYLQIEWRGEGEPLLMSGPATTVFEGQISL